MTGAPTVPPAVRAAAPAGPAPPALPSRRVRLRRLRFPLAVGAVVVAAAAFAAFAATGASGDLDPDSGSGAGSRAVAQILRRQGVDVVRTSDPARAARGRGTVVVVHPDLLTSSRLAAATASAARVVLVEPEQSALDAVAPAVDVAGAAAAATLPPRCAATDALAGPARAGGMLYRVRPGTRADVCFRASDAAPLGSLVVLAAGGEGDVVVVLGQADVLRNARLADDANAALALRVLGHDRELVWLVPDPARTADAAPPSLRSLLPAWFGWVVLELVVATLLVLVWRARRLGPVVREPLPVVVRAGETLHGRARLYRRARATDRAAATLRTATLRRLARRLAVPADAAPDVVAVRVAETTGRDVGEVRRVLLGGAPADERGMVRLADELDAVEADVAGRRGAADPHGGRHTEREEDGA